MNLHGVLKYWIQEYAKIAEMEEMYHSEEMDDETFIENMKQFMDRSFVSLCDTLQLASDMEEKLVDLQQEMDVLKELCKVFKVDNIGANE